MERRTGRYKLGYDVSIFTHRIDVRELENIPGYEQACWRLCTKTAVFTGENQVREGVEKKVKKTKRSGENGRRKGIETEKE
jgi:hypothetical protein